CLRIGRMVETHGELFLTRVFTDREIRYCQARKRATEHFAGRWAAKEAILKCLGSGWRRGLAWTDMEVRNEPGGQPRVLMCGGADGPGPRHSLPARPCSLPPTPAPAPPPPRGAGPPPPRPPQGGPPRRFGSGVNPPAAIWPRRG